MSSQKLSKKNEIYNYYKFGRKLGEGTFSEVFLCEHLLSNQKVAIKVLEKSKIITENDCKRTKLEIEIMHRVRHPHIIQLYEIHESEENLFIVMEFASGGELYDYIVSKEKLSEEEAGNFFYQLITAIEYLEKAGICHRDIKPENILLDSKKNLKLIDFGLGTFYKKGEFLDMACGSPCYAAPEIVSRKEYSGEKIDIWSAGVTLFAMICGYLPFDEEELGILYKKILDGSYEIPEGVSEDARDIISKILLAEPKFRPGCSQILNHSFVKKIESSKKIIDFYKEKTFDEEVLCFMEEIGIGKNDVVEQLSKNCNNEITTCYYLFLKGKLENKRENSLGHVNLRRTSSGGLKCLDSDLWDNCTISGMSSSKNSSPENIKKINKKFSISKEKNDEIFIANNSKEIKNSIKEIELSIKEKNEKFSEVPTNPHTENFKSIELVPDNNETMDEKNKTLSEIRKYMNLISSETSNLVIKKSKSKLGDFLVKDSPNPNINNIEKIEHASCESSFKKSSYYSTT